MNICLSSFAELENQSIDLERLEKNIDRSYELAHSNLAKLEARVLSEFFAGHQSEKAEHILKAVSSASETGLFPHLERVHLDLVMSEGR